MEAILEMIVEYRTICIWISVFLILALIGALADRSASKRFAIDTEKMRSNVNNATVDEANKTAGEAPELTNTNITSGNTFGEAPKIATTTPEKTEESKVETTNTNQTAEASEAPVSQQVETL